MVFKSKAIDYLYEWKALPIESTSDLYKYWDGIWKTKKQYEEELVKEVKGF